jgi:hypothetical protein
MPLMVQLWHFSPRDTGRMTVSEFISLAILADRVQQEA